MKIGILSFAHHHGEAYIANLRRMPEEGVELVGLADDDPMRGQTVAANAFKSASSRCMRADISALVSSKL